MPYVFISTLTRPPSKVSPDCWTFIHLRYRFALFRRARPPPSLAAHNSAMTGTPSRFKKIVHGYIDEFDARGQSTYLLHRTLNHKNPEMFPSGNLKL